MENNLKGILEKEQELISLKNEIDQGIKKSEMLLTEAHHVAEKIIVQENLLKNRVINDEQIETMIYSLQCSCLNLNISTESLQVAPYIHMDKSLARNHTVVNIAIEDGITLFDKIVNMIRNLFIWIWNKLKVFYVKLMNSTSGMLDSINNLINYIEETSKKKVFKSLTREEFKGVVNKAPVLFLLGDDPGLIKSALSSSVHLDVSADILKDIETYGRCVLNNPNVDILVFTNEANKAADEVINTKTRHLYNNLIKNCSELTQLANKGRVTVYRADGKKIKYRYITQDKDVSGIKVLNVQNRSYTISRKDEDIINVGKIFRHDEIINILRNTANYISSINTTQNAIKDRISKAQNLTKQIESYAKQNGLRSGVYLLAFNNYYKLVKLLISNIATDTILSNYETAKNIYFACSKYVTLALKESNISKEDFKEYTENDHLIFDIEQVPEVFEIKIEEDGMNEDLLSDSVSIDHEGWLKSLEGIKSKIKDYTVDLFQWEEVKATGKAIQLISWICRWVSTYYSSKKDPTDASEGIINKMKGELDDYEQINKLYIEVKKHEDYILSKHRNLTVYAEFGTHFRGSIYTAKSNLQIFKALSKIETLNGQELTPEQQNTLDHYLKSYTPMINFAEKILKQYIENYNQV